MDKCKPLMTGVMVKMLFAQAEAAGCELAIDTNKLEVGAYTPPLFSSTLFTGVH
jgi:hypothetical protein